MSLLRTAALALDDNFVLGDTLQLPAAGITLKGPFGEARYPASFVASRSGGVAALLAACKPAPFGHGGETVFNPAVRTALAFPGAELSVEGFDVSSLLPSIKSALVPDAAGIEATLDKLNVYNAGGHFAAHRDTPADEAHFGTLVVCLPSHFIGGVLSVRHGGIEKKLDWGTAVAKGAGQRVPYAYSSMVNPGQSYGTPAQQEEARKRRILEFAKLTADPCLQWAAFFGHCEHEISKVTAGCRVTLAYKLRRVDAAPDAVPIPPTLAAPLPAGVTPALMARTNNFLQALQNAVSSPDVLKNGGYFGFPCFHLYVEADLPKIPLSRNAKASGLKLKGADALIAVAAASLGLKVTALRMLTEYNAGTQYKVSRLPDGGDKVKLVHKVKLGSSLFGGGATAMGFETDDIAATLGSGPSYDIDEVNWVVSLPTGGGFSRAADLVPMAKFVDNVWFSDTGYFGNEASEDAFYTHAAIVVAVPSASERGAVVPTPAPPASAPLAPVAPSPSVDLTEGSDASVASPLQPAAPVAEASNADAGTDTGADADAPSTPRPTSSTKPAAAAVDSVTRPTVHVTLSPEALAGFVPAACHREQEEREFEAQQAKASSVAERLQKATIPQLKAVLKSKRMPVGGNKGELVARASLAKVTDAELDAAGVDSTGAEFGVKPTPKKRRRTNSGARVGLPRGMAGMLAFLAGAFGDSEDEDDGDW